MSLNVTLDENGTMLRRVKITEVHPDIFPNKSDDCPYLVTDDLTEQKFCIVHRPLDGETELVQKAFARISEYETALKFLGG